MGEIPSYFPEHSANQIAELLTGGSDSLTGFVAKANISVRSPKENLSFSSTIRHRRDDSLYMSIKPALGIEAGRALVTPDSFFVYDRIKKKLYYGDIHKAGEYLPGPISKADIFGNLLAIPELAGTAYTVLSDTSFYFLTDNVGHETYTVDPRIWRVVLYQNFNPDGELVEEIRYTDFDELDGVVLPRRIVYQHSENGKSASIFFRSIDLNPRNLNLDFNVSDSATPVPVK